MVETHFSELPDVKKFKPALTQPGYLEVHSLCPNCGASPPGPSDQGIQSYVQFWDLEIWRSETLRLKWCFQRANTNNFFYNFKDLQERQGFESLQLSTRLIEDPDEETPEQTSAEEKRNY